MQRLLALIGVLAWAGSAVAAESVAGGFPDISTFRRLLTPPAMTEEEPAAGRRVRFTLPDYAGSGVYGALYLPVD